MDCDGSLDPWELPLVAGPVARGDADLCLGARVAQPGAWPWHARVANRVLAFELRRRCGVAVSDIGPMRAAHREALLELGLRDRGFGWPLEMILRAGGAGWRIGETRVSYGVRSGGRSKVSGPVAWRHLNPDRRREAGVARDDRVIPSPADAGVAPIAWCGRPTELGARATRCCCTHT